MRTPDTDENEPEVIEAAAKVFERRLRLAGVVPSTPMETYADQIYLQLEKEHPEVAVTEVQILHDTIYVKVKSTRPPIELFTVEVAVKV